MNRDDHNYELEEKQEQEIERKKSILENVDMESLIDLVGDNLREEFIDTIKEQLWIMMDNEYSLKHIITEFIGKKQFDFVLRKEITDYIIDNEIEIEN